MNQKLLDEFKVMAIRAHSLHSGEAAEETAFDDVQECTYGFCRERYRLYGEALTLPAEPLSRFAHGLVGLPVLIEVCIERVRQDAKHGGPAHDDTHSRKDWTGFIEERLSGLPDKDPDYRVNMIEIAALAIAAVESRDRVEGRQ